MAKPRSVFRFLAKWFVYLIFSVCCPTKITDTIVRLASVNVIHLWFVRRIGQKRRSHKTMPFHRSVFTVVIFNVKVPITFTTFNRTRQHFLAIFADNSPVSTYTIVRESVSIACCPL